MPSAEQPVAVQTLPLFLPITSLVMSAIAIVVFGWLLVVGHRRHETGPVRNRLLIAIIVAALVLQIGAPLNQLNILPTEIWTWISLAGRLVVLISLLTLATLGSSLQEWLDGVVDRWHS